MNPRRLIAILGACSCLCLAGTQCSSPVAKEPHAVGTGAIDPELGYRLSPYWISNATKIKAGDCSVYFRGEAEPPVTKPSTTQWSGAITGEILIVDKGSATICGGVVIGPDGGFQTTTRGKTYVGKKERWQHLILP